MNPSIRHLRALPVPAAAPGAPCTLLPIILDPGPSTEALHGRLEEAGCPLAPSVRDRINFETLLADLSAMFVNVPAGEVDAQITVALRQIVEFLGIDRSGFGQLVSSQGAMAITHSYQVDGVPPTPKVILETQFPVYARLMREGMPFRLPDDVQDIADATAEREYLSHSGLRSQLTIPLKVAGTVVGGIGFASFKAHVTWPEEVVRRLQLVGDILTNALARKHADEDFQVLASRLLTAQEEERRLIARELHDDWSQRLAVLGLEVARLEKALHDPAAVARLLRVIQGQLMVLSGDVHDMSRQLHPAILGDLGLVEALRSECMAFGRREGITVDYRADAVPRELAPDVALCVYRIAQEALRNVARHAAVSTCRVTITVVDHALELAVRDEGVGFEPAAVRREVGIGLASMEERARLARARFTVISAPDAGTTVVVRASLSGARP